MIAKTHQRASKFLFSLVLLAAFAVVFVSGCGGSGTSSKKVTYGKPAAATATQLVAYQTQVKHPVYWLGPYKGFTYELTETTNGNSYVRYLPPGIKVGNTKANWTVVGTYPSANAYAAVLANIKKL